MSTTTVRIKASEIYKDWHVIDAAGLPLGRVASEAAKLLRGKHKPTFEPHLDDGDFVIIVNAAQVTLSGNKVEQVRYHRHTGYAGGLRTRTFTDQMERSPRKVMEKAVWGMLPKGPLGEQMLRHLKVYPGPDHPHASQITGSERAKAAREAATAEALKEPRKVRRLRPLSIPDASAETVSAAPETAAKAPARKRPSRTKAPAEETVTAAEEIVTPPVAEEVVEAVVEESAEAAPKPRRARAKKADSESTGTADSDTTEKPKRTRAKKAGATETSAEEAPKPRRSRAKKTETEGEES